jgi:hypothetical protein
MKKLTVALCSVFLLVLLSGCTGPRGEAYQQYWWSAMPTRLYDTNPSTPSTVVNDVYFPTNSGSFYMEYTTAITNVNYYLYYTITTEESNFFLSPGDDSWFEICLFSTGPSLYKWPSPLSVIVNEPNLGDATSSGSISITDERISTGKRLGEVLGTETREYPNGSIKLEWGKILED